MFSLLLVLFKTTFFVAFGGGGMGSAGGDVVRCDNAYAELGHKTMAMLDLVQGTMEWGFEVTMPAGVDETAIANGLIDRLEELDPHRAARYRHDLRQFFGNTKFVDHLPDVHDEGPVLLPGRDCEVVQAAYQKAPLLPTDRWFNIKQSIWQQLAAEDRASLIMHEIIFREVRAHNLQESIRAKYFNGFLSSSKAIGYDLNSYRLLLTQIIGLPYRESSDSWFENCRARSLAPAQIPGGDLVIAVDASSSTEANDPVVGGTCRRFVLADGWFEHITDKRPYPRRAGFTFADEPVVSSRRFFEQTGDLYHRLATEGEQPGVKDVFCQSEGGTNFEQALSHALAVIEEDGRGSHVPKTILVVSDGEPADGLEGQAIAEEIVRRGIFLQCIPFQR